MAKIGYRFVPCDDEGRPRENSHFMFVRDAAEEIKVGSVIAFNVLGFSEWEVVELRASSDPLVSATEPDGTSIPLGGTLVCRGVRRD
jgi:hypothetical protein